MLRPAFETQYSPRFVEAVYDEIDVTNTIRPERLSTIDRATACVRKYGPWRLVPTTSSKLSSVASSRSRRWRGAMPALFTSKSTRPYSAMARCTNCVLSVGDATSMRKIAAPHCARKLSAASKFPR